MFRPSTDQSSLDDNIPASVLMEYCVVFAIRREGAYEWYSGVKKDF